MDYTLLRGAIRREYKTAKEFSKHLGLTENGLYLKLNNKSEFTVKQIIECVRLLGLGIDDIGNYFFTKEVRKN